MFWIYLASAMFGCVFLVPMLLGGLAADTDVELDSSVGSGLDAGLDVDTDMGFDADVAGADVAGADVAGADVGADTDVGGDVELGTSHPLDRLLSFRSFVFVSAFFGTSGLVFDILDYSTVVTALSAVLIGTAAGVANSALYAFLHNTQSNSQLTDVSLEGRPAVVTLPIEAGRRGRVRIDMAGQPHYLVARSFDESMAQPHDDQFAARAIKGFDIGAPVVVVQIEQGTALVASLDFT